MRIPIPLFKAVMSALIVILLMALVVACGSGAQLDFPTSEPAKPSPIPTTPVTATAGPTPENPEPTAGPLPPATAQPPATATSAPAPEEQMAKPSPVPATALPVSEKSNAEQDGSVEADREALIALYEATGGPDWAGSGSGTG